MCFNLSFFHMTQTTHVCNPDIGQPFPSLCSVLSKPRKRNHLVHNHFKKSGFLGTARHSVLPVVFFIYLYNRFTW